MTGLDANVLAGYDVDDAADDPARRQGLAARRLVESGRPLFVCKTVILELEWVLRGHYGFAWDEIATVFAHPLALPQVTVEDRTAVERAVSNAGAGLDFADALHHASCADCERLVTFDDRRFARRAAELALAPPVALPG